MLKVEHGHQTENETIDALLEHISDKDGDGSAAVSELPILSASPSEDDASSEEATLLRGDVLRNVKLKVKVELGRVRMELRKALNLSPGSVIELGKESGSPVDILVNSIPIARGQILVVDNRFCIRIVEIITTQEAEDS